MKFYKMDEIGVSGVLQYEKYFIPINNMTFNSVGEDRLKNVIFGMKVCDTKKVIGVLQFAVDEKLLMHLKEDVELSATLECRIKDDDDDLHTVRFILDKISVNAENCNIRKDGEKVIIEKADLIIRKGCKCNAAIL